MRQLLLILGVAFVMAAPLSAQASTDVGQVTFDDTFSLCNGDAIHVSGTLLATTTETETPSGGLLFAFHFQPQGVTGVDLVTGTVFRATGLTRDLIVESPPGGSTETFVNRFHIQATGGAESYIVTDLIHVTITPDGTIRADIEMHSESC